jgi:hypothetical protein
MLIFTLRNVMQLLVAPHDAREGTRVPVFTRAREPTRADLEKL